MNIEYRKSYCQLSNTTPHIITVPEIQHHETNFVTTIRRLEQGAHILITSSKKKPNTNANRSASTTSKFPGSFGVFTTRVYSIKNKNVKNTFMAFWYRGTTMSASDVSITFDALCIEVIGEISRCQMFIFPECESIIFVVLYIIISHPKSANTPLEIICGYDLRGMEINCKFDC